MGRRTDIFSRRAVQERPDAAAGLIWCKPVGGEQLMDQGGQRLALQELPYRDVGLITLVLHQLADLGIDRPAIDRLDVAENVDIVGQVSGYHGVRLPNQRNNLMPEEITRIDVRFI